MMKILMLIASIAVMDSDGWVAVERPFKSFYIEEGKGEEDLQAPDWVAFGKQTGIEKVLVSFPSTPIYLYGEEGLIAASSFKEMHFQFEIRERVFTNAKDLLEWRLQALEGRKVKEKNAKLNEQKEPVVELTYWDGKKWVFEWWKSTYQNTYAQITQSPTENPDFHRQFLASFDLELDRKIHA